MARLRRYYADLRCFEVNNCSIGMIFDAVNY